MREARRHAERKHSQRQQALHRRSEKVVAIRFRKQREKFNDKMILFPLQTLKSSKSCNSKISRAFALKMSKRTFWGVKARHPSVQAGKLIGNKICADEAVPASC